MSERNDIILWCHWRVMPYLAQFPKIGWKSLLLSARNNPCYTLPSQCQSCPHDKLNYWRLITLQIYLLFWFHILLRTQWGPHSNVVTGWSGECSRLNTKKWNKRGFLKIVFIVFHHILLLLQTKFYRQIYNEQHKIICINNHETLIWLSTV